MPRNVRNYWIEAEIDGRATPLAGGPKGKEGGLRLCLKRRNHGLVETILILDGRSTREDLIIVCNFLVQPNTVGPNGFTFECRR